MSHKTCPYSAFPPTSFWKRSVAKTDLVAPQGIGTFTISKNDRVATAGSCFAQHIARYLRNAGIPPYVVEPAPQVLDSATAEKFQYGTYSARYGNIYTSRQLLQLFKRAFGEFSPVERAWEHEGRLIDPLRPSVHPVGYESHEELEADRTYHLSAVRRMFETLDVFIFTLGLTETWLDKRDGLAYPVCPGCGWGNFDESLYEFANLSVDDIAGDLKEFLAGLSRINPDAKVILTVSPVPLVATGEARHVLESTVYSKAVLRVAAESIARSHADVAYFPSFEIITGPHARGAYYEDDLRSVTSAGVSHVMKVFFRTYLPAADFIDGVAGSKTSESFGDGAFADRLAELICEEEQLDGQS